MVPCGAKLCAVVVGRGCGGAVLLPRNRTLLPTEFRHSTYSSVVARCDWSDTRRRRDHRGPFRFITGARSVESFRARTHEVRLRRGSDAGASFSAREAHDAVAVYRL